MKIKYTKKLYVILELLTGIPVSLVYMLDHYFGSDHKEHVEFMYLPFDNLKWHNPCAIMLLVNLVQIFMVACLWARKLNYTIALMLIVYIVWYAAELYHDKLPDWSMKWLVCLYRVWCWFGIILYSVVHIWLAYDLVVSHWNRGKREGNEAPVEEEDKLIARHRDFLFDQVDQEAEDNEVKGDFKVNLLLMAAIDTIALICWFQNVAIYIPAAVLVGEGIFSITVIITKMEEDHTRFTRAVMIVLSSFYIWLAYELMRISWNSAIKKDNEDPVEEKEEKKKIMVPKAD